MATQAHHYALALRWTGAGQDGTRDYQAYGRDYDIAIGGKPVFRGSADPMFRGDPGLPNPEDWLLAALSACHMLSYLALCARRRVTVLAYEDEASGSMSLHADGGGEFTEVQLRPRVVIADDADLEAARALHERAHALCFIARSCNFPVRVHPQLRRPTETGPVENGAGGR